MTDLREPARWRVSPWPLVMAVCAALTDLEPATLHAQSTAVVEGSVISPTGEPLVGAQVAIRSLGLGALANSAGRYRIPGVAPGTHEIRVEHLGYAAGVRTVVVQAGNTVTVDFELRVEAIPLDGVVVTGPAGIGRRREIGNSVAQVHASQTEGHAVADLGDILQGRVLGMILMDNSGQVGAGNMIRIRGNNSVSRVPTPLVYVDGVRIQSEPYGTINRINQSANPLSDINPNDIERIEIAKGAAATTLYGTEAASGVIQIFTKRGAAGAPSWSASIEQGVNSMGHVGPDEDVNPTGLGMNRCDSDLDPMFPADATCPASGSWLRNGWIQRYNLSVRGGTERTNYFVSTRWADERGAIDGRATPTDRDLTGALGAATQGAESWNVRGNFGFTPSESLEIRFNSAYSRQEIDWVSAGNSSRGLPINVMRGTRAYTGNLGDGLVTAEDYSSVIDHFFTGFNVVLSTGPRLAHRVNAGLDWTQSVLTHEVPWGNWLTAAGLKSVDDVSRRKLTLDYMATWSQHLAQLSSSLSWGGQLHDDHHTGVFVDGEGFSGPGRQVVQFALLTRSSELDNRVKSAGAFVQETLGWNDRLFLTGGLRFDSHTAFGRDVTFETYPKASLSWIASDGDLGPPWLGSLKLRAAIGEAGDPGGVFDAARIWEAREADEQELGVRISSIGNPDLGPERSREWEVGFEGTAFDGRVAVEYTYFDQRTRGALVGVPQPPSGGFPGRRQENVGEIRNRGHEGLLSLDVLRAEPVEWRVEGRVSTHRSQVVSLGSEADDFNLGWRNHIRAGEPVPSYCGKVVANPDEIGKPVLEERCLGSTMPTHTYAIGTTVTVGDQVTIDVLGEGMGGHVLTSGTAWQNARREVWPGCREILERIENGEFDQLTAGERGRCNRRDIRDSSWTQPGDFFKIRSASVSWRVPRNWLPSSIARATLSLQGRNLLTLTDFVGLDPEASEDGSSGRLYRAEYYNLPPLRTFLLGLRVDF